MLIWREDMCSRLETPAIWSLDVDVLVPTLRFHFSRISVQPDCNEVDLSCRTTWCRLDDVIHQHMHDARPLDVLAIGPAAARGFGKSFAALEAVQDLPTA